METLVNTFILVIYQKTPLVSFGITARGARGKGAELDDVSYC